MLRLLSRLALVTLTLIPWLLLQPCAYAQSASNPIVSIVEDTADRLLLLNTAVLKPAPPPSICYVPGNNQDTILIADFPGLMWNHPVHSLTPKVPGVKAVQVKQVQQQPPVCRIAISTSQPELMHKLAFLSQPGTLVLKWPSPEPNPKNIPVPNQGAPLPGVSSSAANWHTKPRDMAVKQPQLELQAQAGYLRPAPDRAASVAQSVDRRAVKRPASEQPGAVKPRPVPHLVVEQSALEQALDAVMQPNKQPVPLSSTTASPAAAQKLAWIDTQSSFNSHVQTSNPPDLAGLQPGRCVPQISISNQESLGVQLSAPQTFAYRSFRLHNPERYVIDVPGLPELAAAALPPTPPNSFLSSLRVGQPEQDACGRLVLDLCDAQVQVKEVFNNAQHMLSLLLGKPGEPLASLELPLKLPVNKTIVLDAGHGGSDPGAQRGDIQEKEITLGIVDKLRKKLAQAGAKVTLTRADDSFVSLQDRVAITNQTHPDLFLSVHINSLEANSTISGIETYFQTSQSQPLALAVHNALVHGLQAPDRGLRRARFYVIKYPTAPAILAEVGFISNKEERDKLISFDYQDKVADALAHGVMLYLSGQTELPVDHMQPEQ